jgi:hypothetical protein
MRSLILQSAPFTPPCVTTNQGEEETLVVSSCELEKHQESGSDCLAADLVHHQTSVTSSEKVTSSVGCSASSCGCDNDAALDGADVLVQDPSQQKLRWMPEKTPVCRVNELARFNKVG